MKLFILLFILINTVISAQYSDTIDTKSVQYRRGIPLQEGYQTYAEKYSGKNLIDEKRRLFPLESAGIWAELNPKVPRVDYTGLHFVNKDTGWACGLYGAFIKSTNGGENWQTIETQTSEILLKVHSFNGEMVMAVGHNGVILRSTDGGETFNILSGITTEELWGVRMLNDTLGWICGRNQTLLKTTDAGLNWESVITGYNYHYWSFDFLDQNYWMIACSQGKVLKTNDGGLSWTQYQAGNIEDLYTIDIIDSLHIAAAGYLGKTVYSSDGGISWVENQQYSANPVNWIQFINRDTGYIALESSVSLHKTTNRGESWTEAGFSHTGEWQFELLMDNVGYGVGSGLKVTKTEDQFNTGNNLFLNVNWSDVYFVNEQKGFFISNDPGSGVYKTSDGGMTYQKIDNSPIGNDLIFLDSLTGFIGGNTIYKTIDGGESWYTVNGITDNIKKIFFINHQTGWAAGGPRIFKTTDGGENWFEQLFDLSEIFRSIFFIDSLNGWAVSRSFNGIYNTTNGGNEWIQRSDIQIYETNDIYFFNLMKGWIISGNELYYTSDGGSNWILDPQIYTYTWHFESISQTHFIITGSNIYESTDTGQVWQNIINGNRAFASLNAPKDYLAFGAGNYGLIMSYFDTTYVPVELISFSAKCNDHYVLLSWETATELNNKGFEIQRSYHGYQRSDWYTIGFIEGMGTTTLTNHYSCTDKNVTAGKYIYRLKQLCFDGSFEYSKEVEVDVTAPMVFSLEQNYPNPFNPETKISFTIPEETNVSIKLYDITGREIGVLVNENKRPGYYTIKLKGGELSSGVYFYRLVTTSGYTAVKKLILLK